MDRKEACFYIDNIKQHKTAKSWFQKTGGWIFRGHADASWGLTCQFERKKKGEKKDKDDKKEDQKEAQFSLSTQFISDHSPDGIAQHIAQYEACGDTRIVSFFLDIDLALKKAIEKQNIDVEVKTDGAIWAIKRDKLVEGLRKRYPLEKSLPEEVFCLNHACEICSRIGRNSNGTKGVVVPLIINECLVIPSRSGSFSENIEAALGCNLDNIEKDEESKNIQMEDVFAMPSCVLMKMIITDRLKHEIRNCQGFDNV